MLKLCAWHKKYFGRGKFMGIVKPYFSFKVTHGMCPACHKKEMEKITKEKQERAK